MVSNAFNEFQQRDAVTWGGVAIIAVVLMLLSPFLNVILPVGALNSLRETRHMSGTIGQLQAELTSVRLEFASFKRELTITKTQIALSEETGKKFSRRIDALEGSIPVIMSSLPADPGVDRSVVTAAIKDTDRQVIRSDNTVRITRSKLFEVNTSDSGDTVVDEGQPLPEMIGDAVSGETDTANSVPEVQFSATEFGIILGPSTFRARAPLLWDQLKTEIGTLLLGLDPRILPAADNNEKVSIIAGPLQDMADALVLCMQVSRAGFSCEASRFGGEALDR